MADLCTLLLGTAVQQVGNPPINQPIGQWANRWFAQGAHEWANAPIDDSFGKSIRDSLIGSANQSMAHPTSRPSTQRMGISTNQPMGNRISESHARNQPIRRPMLNDMSKLSLRQSTPHAATQTRSRAMSATFGEWPTNSHATGDRPTEESVGECAIE